MAKNLSGIGKSNKIAIISLLSVSLFSLSFSRAETDSDSPFSAQPAEIEADEMNYLEKEQLIIAKGNVDIKSEERELRAEEVTYNKATGIITASGNISLKDKNGYVYYADSAEINDDLTKGYIVNLRGQLEGDAKFAADKGRRESQYVTILENAVYSPCKLCKNRHKGKPLWDISADKVTLNSSEERMYYKNANFDIYGVSVFYTPYLSHASPGASKKSGFLVPTFSNISNLGFTVRTPYYMNIAPNIDNVIEPMFTSYEGVVLRDEFRHLTRNGKYELKGSITNPAERDINGNKTTGHEIRGHVEGFGDFKLSNDWGWGFEGKRSSDDTYLNRYKFGDEDLLTSRAYTEKIYDRYYLGAQVISFQGLNATDDPGQTPLIFPLVSNHFEKPTEFMNSRFEFDNNAMILERDEGVKSRRVSSKGKWVLPYITDAGHVFEAGASLRGDAYSVEEVPFINNTTKDGGVGRIIPEVKAGWSYPLVRTIEKAMVFLEPLANLIVSPSGNNPDKIPNEDSQGLELSDINLFDSSHFTGLDRVEGGPRSNYGLRAGITDNYTDINILFGQSFRAVSDNNFSAQSGLDNNFSDYAGRVNISDKKYTDLSYRFRLDKDDFVLRRNEIAATLNLSPFNFGADYILLDEEAANADKHEFTANAGVRLTENWSYNVNGRRDLTDGAGWITAGTGVIYEDECLRVITSLTREFTRDRDVEPATIISVKIELMGLGT